MVKVCGNLPNEAYCMEEIGEVGHLLFRALPLLILFGNARACVHSKKVV
jgi:hypothetical protein